MSGRVSLPKPGKTRYVLDFLVDLCTPYLGKDTLRGTWAIGFFGRWVNERNEFESAKSQNQKFRWNSLGAEVFGVRTGKGKTAKTGASQSGSYLLPHGKVQTTKEETKKSG
eukprot:s173_g11.t1